MSVHEVRDKLGAALAAVFLVVGCAERSESPLAPAADAPLLGADGDADTIQPGASKPSDEPHPVGGDPLPPAAPRQIVVEVQGGDPSPLNEAYGTETILCVGGSEFALLAVPHHRTASELASIMPGNAGCRTAELNYLIETPEAGQGAVAFYEGDAIAADVVDQQALSRIGLDEVGHRTDGRGVTVAVLDTGIDYTHPDLASSVVRGWDFADGDPDPMDERDGRDQDRDGLVDEAAGHGTHVAGIVHAIAPAAALLAVRVLDSEGIGTAIQVAQGIRFAAEAGARVINLSLGTEVNSGVIRDAIVWAERERNVFFVSAAGNAGIKVDEHYPARYEEVLSVAAVADDDLRAPFSTYGRFVEVSAPGVGILSTYLDHGYASWSGTSMATPMVAAAGALYIGRRPWSAAARVSEEIEDNAAALDHRGLPYAGLMGDGRLDLDGLVSGGEDD